MHPVVSSISHLVDKVALIAEKGGYNFLGQLNQVIDSIFETGLIAKTERALQPLSVRYRGLCKLPTQYGLYVLS